MLMEVPSNQLPAPQSSRSMCRLRCLSKARINIRMERLRELFSLSSLLVALAFALLLGIAVVVIETGFPFAYALVAWVVWTGANHFVEILEQRGRGEGWAVFSLDTIASARSQLGVVFLLELAAIALIYLALTAIGGEGLGRVWAILAVLGLPASVALLAVTRDLRRALNPVHWLRAALKVGLRYLAILAASVAVGALIALAYRRRGLVEFFAAAYAWFLLAHSIGAVVYARRNVLGIHAPRSPEAKFARELDRLHAERRGVLDHAYGIAAHGNIGGGLTYVEQYVKSARDPLEARTWMFHEMMRWEDARPALAFGERLVGELESAHRGDEAAKIRLSRGYLEEKLRASVP